MQTSKNEGATSWFSHVAAEATARDRVHSALVGKTLECWISVEVTTMTDFDATKEL
jgi:hypothetical protein